MSEQDLARLLQDFGRRKVQIELLEEKRELKLELRELAPDQHVGRGYFFRMEIDQEIEKHEQKLRQLTMQIERLEKQQIRDEKPERSWRDYAGEQHERAIEAKDRVVDAGRAVRDKMKDVLPQRGNPERTEAERLQQRMDAVVQTHFPDIYAKQKADLRAKERAQEQRERPWIEGKRELERKAKKAERARVREEMKAEKEQPEENRKDQVRQRIEVLNERLRDR